jgi:hypothetical protein
MNARLVWLGVPMVTVEPGHRYTFLTTMTEDCNNYDETSPIAALSLAGWENITILSTEDVGLGCNATFAATWPASSSTSTIDIGAQLPSNLSLVQMVETSPNSVSIWPPAPGTCPPLPCYGGQQWSTTECKCIDVVATPINQPPKPTTTPTPTPTPTPSTPYVEPSSGVPPLFWLVAGIGFLSLVIKATA